MTIPAGWYDDGSGRQRWWDGAQWTERLLDAPAAAVDPAVQAAASANVDAPTYPATATPAVDPGPTAPAANYPGAPSPTGYPGIPDPAGYPGSPTAANYPGYATVGTPDGTSPYAAAAPYGTTMPYGAVPGEAPKPQTSVAGLIGLAAAVIGIVLSCVPSAAPIGWALLGVGFLVSLISLFLRGAKWPGFLGLGATALGGVLAVAVTLISFSAPTAPTAGESPEPTSAPTDGPAVPADPDSIEGAVMTDLLDLTVGDCVPLIDYEEYISQLPVVPCDQPHTDEVYYITQATEAEFPGDKVLQQEAVDICDAQFATFIGIPYTDSQLDYYYFVPTKRTWALDNDRAIQCIVYSDDNVTGTLAGAAR